MESVAVIGFGYVGLCLVVEFGKKRRTIRFDIFGEKVAMCRAGRDPSRKSSASAKHLATLANYSSDPKRSPVTAFIKELE